jgi:hypothetical protein
MLMLPGTLQLDMNPISDILQLLIPSAQDANSSESEMSQTGERWGTVRAV